MLRTVYRLYNHLMLHMRFKKRGVIGGVTAVMIVIVVIIIVANIYCAYVGFPTINHFNPHKFIMK